MLFCSYVIFLLRDEWMIERFSLVKQLARPWLATTSRQFYWNFISHEKEKWHVTALYLQSIKTLLALELSQYRKSGSMFSSSEPAATAADSETPCVCARPSDPRKQSWRAAPRAWPLILPSKPSIAFWNSLRRDVRWPAAAWAWTQLELCRLTNEL